VIAPVIATATARNKMIVYATASVFVIAINMCVIVKYLEVIAVFAVLVIVITTVVKTVIVIVIVVLTVLVIVGGKTWI
jgi:hypothetical protein